MPNVTQPRSWNDPIIDSYLELMSTTSDTLTNLHDHYVEAVNMAVADGDDARVAA